MKKIGLLFLLATLFSCQQDDGFKTKPQAIKPEHQCAVDGMILTAFSGPKAQMHYKDRPKEKMVDHYCETEEMFKVYLEPGISARIYEMFVQDTAKVDWKKPVGNWIKAREAVYIGESKLDGAMGKTFAPFSNKEDALIFQKKHGGKFLTFDDLISHIKKKQH